MAKKCPVCNSSGDVIWRSHPTSLAVHCDFCGHEWQATQALEPIRSTSLYLSKPLKGMHHIEVWYCEGKPTKYSYRTAYQNSFFDELRGEFDSPNEALEAGIKEVKGNG